MNGFDEFHTYNSHDMRPRDEKYFDILSQIHAGIFVGTEIIKNSKIKSKGCFMDRIKELIADGFVKKEKRNNHKRGRPKVCYLMTDLGIDYYHELRSRFVKF